MSQTKAQLIAGASNQDVIFDDATVNSLNGGPISGTRNRIINGNFDIWQRGTSTGSWVAPITNYYWADRWVANSSGTGGAGSLSQQAFTPGQTNVPGEPTFFQSWQITSAASGQTAGNCWIEQRIEDVLTLAGQTATLSFYAKGTGTLPNIFATQTFGSGGSTQVAYTLASNVVLSSTWTKYTYTVSLASISGKTVGTNHYVGITFMVPLNTTYTFDLAQVQFEPGTVATPLERRSYGQELALCQRYFQVARLGDWGVGGVCEIGNFASGSLAYFTRSLVCEMRTAPTVTLPAASSVGLTATSSAVPTTCSSMSTGGATTTQIYYGANTATTSGSAGQAATLKNVTTAAILTASAEL
jgi:hypothetical protein